MVVNTTETDRYLGVNELPYHYMLNIENDTYLITYITFICRMVAMKVKHGHRGHNKKKTYKPERINRVFHVSFPFSRAIVKKRKIFELRSFPAYKTIKNNRVFIGETVTPIKFNGVHEDLKGYRARGGYVIGSVSIVGSELLTDSHLTTEFASQCGITLDGLKKYKSQHNKVYVWILEDGQSYKRTKPTSSYLLNPGKHVNIFSKTSVKPLR